MKKLNSLFILNILLLASCNDHENVVIDEIDPGNNSEMTFANVDVLNRISNEVLSLSTDPFFRQSLYNLVETQQFGEHSILTEYLGAYLSQQSNPLSRKSKASQYDSLFNADHETLYPQIYIPFYEEHVENGDIGAKDPVIVVFDGDESKEFYTGYAQATSGSGRLTRLEVAVNEEYAIENEVWVISYNESLIDFEGTTKVALPELCPIDDPNCGGEIGGGSPLDDWGYVDLCASDGVPQGGNATDSNGINVFLEKLKVKCHKEGWIAGRSEVVMALTSNGCAGVDLLRWKTALEPQTINGNTFYQPTIQQFEEFEWKIKRSDVKDKKTFTLNKNLTEQKNLAVDCPITNGTCYIDYYGTVGWGYSDGKLVDGRGDYIYYLIYEQDAVFNGKKHIFSNCPNEVEIYYPSRESAYDYGLMSWYKPTGYINNLYPCYKGTNNSCIEYRFYTKKHEPVTW